MSRNRQQQHYKSILVVPVQDWENTMGVTTGYLLCETEKQMTHFFGSNKQLGPAPLNEGDNVLGYLVVPNAENVQKPVRALWTDAKDLLGLADSCLIDKDSEVYGAIKGLAPHLDKRRLPQDVSKPFIL